MNKKITICVLICIFATNLVAKMQDPTKPPKKLAPKISVETQQLKLKMIKLDNKTGERTANINGELVKIGGIYADARIVDITSNSVELRGPKGEKILLKLIKKRHKAHQGGDVAEDIFPDIKGSVAK